MRHLIVALLVISTSIFAKDEKKAEAVYVGGGRFACSGNSYECAQVNANNRAQEERQRYDYERQQQQYDREQGRRREEDADRYRR